MKVCIVCYGFKEENTRLQPWRYFFEIASGLIQNNFDVTIITDGAPQKHYINNISINHIKGLRALPFVPNIKLISTIELEKPDIILWSVGPIDYLYMCTFKKVGIPIINMFTGPIYTISDITRLGIKEIIKNFRFLSVHMLYASLPSFFASGIVNSPYFEKIVVMSRKNKGVLEAMGALTSKIVQIPAGIDEYDLIKPDDCDSIVNKYGLDDHSFNILYFGSPVTIRGIDSLIRAVSKVKNVYPHVKLIILSRRRRDDLKREETFIRNLIKKLELEENVQIISGFLEKEDVKKFICFCNVVALPFKIVPADIPTSILESMAIGKTVISTDVDGIPELLEDGRGIVVPSNNEDELARKIMYCVANKDSLQKISNKSVLYMQTYPRWYEVSESAMKVITDSFQPKYNQRDNYMSKRPMFICITGIDGAGKTTHVKLILKYLRNKGIRCEYKWLRFHHFVSLPLLAFCKIAGYTHVSTLGGIQKCSFHEFYRSRLISTMYPWVLLIDTVLFTTAKVYIPMLTGTSIVCDRFVYDTLIDVAVATNDHEIYKKPVGKLYLKLIPNNARFVMLSLDKSVILSRRNELKDDATFDERYRLYQNFADELGIKVFNNDITIDRVNSSMIDFLFGS